MIGTASLARSGFAMYSSVTVKLLQEIHILTLLWELNYSIGLDVIFYSFSLEFWYRIALCKWWWGNWVKNFVEIWKLRNMEYWIRGGKAAFDKLLCRALGEETYKLQDSFGLFFGIRITHLENWSSLIWIIFLFEKKKVYIYIIIFSNYFVLLFK